MSFEQNSDFSKKFREALWPFSLPYAFKWKTEFVCCLQPDLLFQHKGPLLVRDGELPLSWFFREYPEPPADSELQLILSYRMKNLVPVAWKAKARFYQVCSSPYSESQPQELLLFAHLSTDYFASDELAKNLEEIKQVLGVKVFQKIRKSVYFKMFLWDQSLQSPEASLVKCLMEAGHLLGPDVKVLSWESMNQRVSFEGCLMADLTPPWLYADNHLIHLALSRKARLLTSPISTLADIEKVSPYHGFKIDEDFSRMSEPHISFAWPTWLHQWYRERRGMY